MPEANSDTEPIGGSHTMKPFAIMRAVDYPWDYVVRLPKNKALSRFLGNIPDQECALGLGTKTHAMVFFNKSQFSAFEVYSTNAEK